jgi:hypothetical protein
MAGLMVAFTVSGLRPDYLRRSLQSWAQVRSVGQVPAVFCTEPGEFPADIAELAGRVFASVRIVANEQRLGATANTRAAVDALFRAGASFGVLAEEDIEVASDVLEYFTWASREYEQDGQVMVVCAHVLSSGLRRVEAVVRAPWFNPLTWGTWPGRWEGYLRLGWAGVPSNVAAWDVNLRERMLREKRFSLFPAQSRALHIGMQSSIFPGSGVFAVLHDKHQSRCFQPEYRPCAYEEVPFPQGPSVAMEV